MPVVSSGSLPSAADLQLAEEIQKLYTTQLERVRKAAEQWRTGLAALLTLITTASVIKGEEAASKLSSDYQLALGISAGLALASGAIGGYCAMRAAFGIPSFGPPELIFERRKREAKKARCWLNWAIGLTFLTLALIAVAVGTTWYGANKTTSVLKAEGESPAACGEVKQVDGTTLTLVDGKLETKIPMKDVRSLKIADGCD